MKTNYFFSYHFHKLLCLKIDYFQNREISLEIGRQGDCLHNRESPCQKGRVDSSGAVRKIIQDQALGILVIPNWPTQPWYPMLMPLLSRPPVILHPSTDLLRIKSSPETVHPLHKKLELHICLVSGKNFHNRACPEMQ